MAIGRSGVSMPVTNLQNFLRTISNEYQEVTTVIPDGIYGNETTQSVTSFQNLFGITPTGEVDNDTWDKVVEVYDGVVEKRRPPNSLQPFSYVRGEIRIGNTGDQVYIVQIMVNTIGTRYRNVQQVELTGIYDEPTSLQVRTLQPIGHLPATGNVDKATWNMLTDIFHSVRAEQTRHEQIHGSRTDLQLPQRRSSR